MAVLIALVMIGHVPQQVQPNRPASERRSSGISLTAIAEGVKFILSKPIIYSTMIIDFFATFFSSANTLMPIFARDILHVGAIEYGWLSSAQSIGAVSAALILSQVPIIRRQGVVFLVSVGIFGLATTVFGFTRVFPLALLSLMVVGASDAVSTIIRNTIRQLHTPDYIRGRMVGVNQLFFMGGPQLGEVEAGAVAQLFGTPAAIVSGGIGCLVAVGWIASRYPMLKVYDGQEALKGAA